MLVAPTEPAGIKVLGQVSSVPERYGADVLMVVNGEMVGVQRKELSDLIASVNDGRLAKEIQQMKSLAQGVLVVEGKPRWTTEGTLVSDYSRWSRQAHSSLLFSVQAQGVWVESSDDVSGTVLLVQHLDKWLRKSNHQALNRRPAATSMWGKVENEDYARHLIMGLPGVGPELAERIRVKFGVPFRWRVGVDELMEVEGIGRKKAETIWGCMRP